MRGRAVSTRRPGVMLAFTVSGILARCVFALCVLSLCVLSLQGCASPPPILSLQSHAQEKDVLVVNVELAEPIGADEYLSLAETKLAELGDPPVSPYFDVPLYEVHYRFRQGQLALATVYFRSTASEQGRDQRFRHLRTYVFSHAQGAYP